MKNTIKLPGPSEYKQKCNDCLSVLKYYSDSCLECGSQNIYEFHITGCNCVECETLYHIVKFKGER